MTTKLPTLSSFCYRLLYEYLSGPGASTRRKNIFDGVYACCINLVFFFFFCTAITHQFASFRMLDILDLVYYISYDPHDMS